MTSRQFDATIPTAKTEIPAARQTDAAKGEVRHGAHHDPLGHSALEASSIPDDPRAVAAVLLQASGGRLGRVGTALLQLQRDHGNRYVQQVVTHASQAEGAPPSRRDQAPLTPAAGAAGGPAPASLHRSISAARHGGRALDGRCGAQLGQAFGSDFSRVMVHTDARADALTRSLRASAFTVGRDIFFSKGAYAPGTSSGRELLAHELAHVVQQAAAAGAGASSRMLVGPADDRHERAADRAAAEIARAGQPRQPAFVNGEPSGIGTHLIGSGAGLTVQRKYLDQPGKDPDESAQKGLAAWKEDTKVTKGPVTASRAKLDQVDQLLQRVLAEKGKSTWEYELQALEAALSQTKYDQRTPAKTSKAFVKRQQAVNQLQKEIQAAQQGIRITKLATSGRPTPLHMVTELRKVGFVDAYLNSLPTGDLELLYDAHMALGAKKLAKAQQLLDQLNPLTPTPVGPTQPRHGWKTETFKMTSNLKLYDLERAGNMMAAQRQLLAYHAATIGGDYAKLMSYKPYKAAPLTTQEVTAGKNYFIDAELREWATTIKSGPSGKNNPLSAAVAQAQPIAAAATAASQARRPAKPPKEALTDEEVTAIRIYTADIYKEMNAVFRDFRVDQPTANWDKYSAIAKLAISGLGKLPKARDTTSYRGDNDIKYSGHAGVLKFGATFRMPNFYSTTKKADQAYAGALVYIFHNKRAGRFIGAFSAYPEEAEILIPPGTAFKITGEYHKQAGTWKSHNGKDLDPRMSPSDFLNVDANGPRKTILEFTEI